MKTEPSTAGRSLRAVSLAITVVSIVTFATMAYSAYRDFNGTVSLLGSRSGGAVQHTTVTGNTALIEFSLTVPNGGLYPLGMTLSCNPTKGLPVTCGAVDVTVAPGQEKAFDLVLNVTDVSQLKAALGSGAPVHLNATATVSLEPFASMSVVFDLGSAISGAQL